jgi:hypothetical protein
MSFHFVSASGGTTTEMQETGSAYYIDSQYTAQNPLNVLANTTINLPNNANFIVNNFPDGVGPFYNASESKILSLDAGDTIGLRVDFTAVSSQTGTKIKLTFDIGGSQGEIFPTPILLYEDAGDIEERTISINGFTGADFVANGALVKFKPSANISIYDIKFFVAVFAKKG